MSSAEPVVAGYRLIELVGQGGIGLVYRGVPVGHEQDWTQEVAVKVLAPEYTYDGEFRERFLREHAIGASLQHPSLVRTLQGGEQDGTLYLIMEFLRGRTLKAVLEEGPLSVEAAGVCLRALAEGLVYAHEQGAVHRDLKPGNVMITYDGRVKLMDFGLARSLTSQRVTTTGTTLGTPSYMAPEQITGADPSPLSDQYSLGVVLFEMVTGRRPFESPNSMLVAMAHMSEPPPAPRSLRPDLPAAVEAVILRMLAKDPVQRYPDLRSVLAEF